MKKISLAIFTFLFVSCLLNAQVVIDYDNLMRHQNVDIKMSFMDSKTKEPLGYVTVYLIPQNDTTITNFAMANDKGKVEIKDILPGKYEVNAELMGYKPYKKVQKIEGWRMDLGGIALEEDAELIDAASISAVGNAISVSGDTLTYNASSFRVGDNAMLEDLLKKMPGMEVSDDGTVKVNGEAVDKITVGGRTFFFNDPSVALKNLPAKIVDKIKVIDKKKDEAAFTEVSTKDDTEKVMDVQLKEEFKKGWFGNLKASGGSSLNGKASDDGLIENDKALFNASGLVAGYNELDQLTLIGNAMNASQSGMVTIVDGSGGVRDPFDYKSGLRTTAQGGANYSTDRIDDMETSASLSYNYSQKDAREKSSRTSFQSDGNDINKDGMYKGLGNDHKLSANFELKKKNTDKFLFEVAPYFKFTTKDRNETTSSETIREGRLLNSSNSTEISNSDVFYAGTTWTAGVKKLGKEKRSITMEGSFSYMNQSGNSADYSVTRFGDSSDIRNLLYANKSNNLFANGTFTYVEPLTDEWRLQGKVTVRYSTQTDDKAARNGDDGSENKYYSSFSGNRDLMFRERILAHHKNDNTRVVFGLQIDQRNNPIISRSLGTERTTGEGEWTVNFSPHAELEWSWDNSNVNVYATGNSRAPMGADIMPALNISNPVQTSMGNIYLRPSFEQVCSARYRMNNPKRNTFLYVGLWAELFSKQTVYATWFDQNGVRYAFPVNAGKPGTEFSLNLDYRTPLNNEKTLTLTVRPEVHYGSSFSYQATTPLSGLDKDNFNYSETLSRLWGNQDGDLFYSGKSGFAESRTGLLGYGMSANLTYRIGEFSFAAGGYASNQITKYELDKNADNNIWNFNASGEVLWEGSTGWNANTSIVFNAYRGFSNGYGKPEFIWNAQIGRQIKAFSINLTLCDILNQRRTLNRKSTAEYLEDTYNNVLGRYFLLGVTWNFGKMNAKNNSKAQSAMWKITM